MNPDFDLVQYFQTEKPSVTRRFVKSYLKTVFNGSFPNLKSLEEHLEELNLYIPKTDKFVLFQYECYRVSNLSTLKFILSLGRNLS